MTPTPTTEPHPDIQSQKMEGVMSEIPKDIRKVAYDLARNSGWSYNEDFKRIAAALLAERTRCAEIIRTDPNRKLDNYYCCSAMDQGVQVCACQAVSIREELAGNIEALAHPTSLPVSEDLVT